MTDKQNTIAILGCGGFIGFHLLKHILNKSKTFVYGIDLHSEKIDEFTKNEQFEFIKTDIDNLEIIEQILKKSSTVISLAALCNPSLYNTVPLKVIESNYTKPVEIVKLCCKHNCRLIHFSTCEVYGKTIACYNNEIHLESVLDEDNTPFITGPVNMQRWCYSAAKQLLERTIFAYGVEHDLDYTIIRPFNFIGPKMDYIPSIDGDGIPRVLACFMDALIFNKPLYLVNGGRNKRCFTYIDDAVRAIMAIVENEKSSNKQIFNIGSPKNEVSIKQLAYRMIAIYKELQPQKYTYIYDVLPIPSLDFYGEGYDDSDRRMPDISKAKTLLNWSPYTDLNTALKKTMIEYIDHYKIQP